MIRWMTPVTPYTRLFAASLLAVVGASCTGGTTLPRGSDSHASAFPTRRSETPSGPTAEPRACALTEPILPSVPGGSLEAIASVPTGQAWAVGSVQAKPIHPLIMYFDGTRWSEPPIPTASVASRLDAVTAVSAADVWAVGHQGVTRSTTLIEHWDGTRWSVVQSPDRANSPNQYLNGVSATSAGDAWAVGAYWSPAHHYATLVQHWDGKSWKVVASPTITALPATATRAVASGSVVSGTPVAASLYSVEPFDNGLSSVSAISADDAWAAGDYYAAGAYRPLVEHWNGTAWQVSMPPGTGSIHSIDATESGTVWALGERSFGGARIWRSSNGHWSVVPSPNVSPSQLLGAAIRSANDILAVGNRSIPLHPLLEHWDGKRWTEVDSSSLHLREGALLSATAPSGASPFFAAGVRGAGAAQTPLIVRGC